MTYTPAAVLPCDHPNDTGRAHPPITLLRALSGPSDPPPVFVEFITLADVADRVRLVGWV